MDAAKNLKTILSEIIKDQELAPHLAAKNEVLSRYQRMFSLENLESLSERDFREFLSFQNNHHWNGLDRVGGWACKDMPALRRALGVLLDERRPITERLDELMPRHGKRPVRGLGQAILTPILFVTHPERYAVLNSITQRGMRAVGMWPAFQWGSSAGERYEEVNRRQLRLAHELDTDLWTLDFVWWRIVKPRTGTDQLRSAPSSPSMAKRETSGWSRYRTLADWLESQGQASARLTFSELEDVLGALLPPSARRYPAFWSTANNAGFVLGQAGWRARLRAAAGCVEFVRTEPPVDSRQGAEQPLSSAALRPEPDLVLIGCVETKRPGVHPARDLYASTLFWGRSARAESTGKPWFILSAKYGLVKPDERIESYELDLRDLSASERHAWGCRVLADLETSIGSLRGKRVEIHAGGRYRRSGLVSGLEALGARVTVPLEGMRIGEQLAWYHRHSDEKSAVGDSEEDDGPSVGADRGNDIAWITRELTNAFMEEAWDLHERPGAPRPGWDAMPEFVAARALKERGESGADVRVFLTLVSALDRARDADRLWRAAGELHGRAPWVFRVEEVVARPLREMREYLSSAGVSQRHALDTAAWRLIAEALIDDGSPESIRRAVYDGTGDARELLRDVGAESAPGQPWFPYLSGPKISAMWVRMLAAPGGAAIRSLDAVPVAVDVQVRKVTEYLGVTETRGLALEAARPVIQEAWRRGALEAVGPERVAGTSAGLDPPLWFFGKWGCTHCERVRERRPISKLCQRCRYQPRA